MWQRLATARAAAAPLGHVRQFHSAAGGDHRQRPARQSHDGRASLQQQQQQQQQLRRASTLPQPPRRPATDSAYSHAAADSAFSVASALEPASLPPVRLVNARGEETPTWTAAHSAQLGPPGRIMIYASQVSGLVGMNPWTQLHEVFEAVWARSDPEQYRHRIAQVEAELGVRLLTREQEAELVLEEHGFLRAQLEAVVARAESLSNDDLTAAKSALKSSARTVPGISPEQSALVGDYLVGQLSKAYGTVNEDRALKAYEQVADLTVVDNNRLFYGREFAVCEIDPTELDSAAVSASASSHAAAGESTAASASPSPSASDSPSLSLNDPAPPLLKRSIWVGGRVDGFSSVSGHLIEMKNRTRRFMTPLPLYDRCQMECYLQICDVDHGELVERLRIKVDSQQAAESIADVQRATAAVAARSKMVATDLDADPEPEPEPGLAVEASRAGSVQPGPGADAEAEDAEFLQPQRAQLHAGDDECDPDFMPPRPAAVVATEVGAGSQATAVEAESDESFASGFSAALALAVDEEEQDSSFMQHGTGPPAPADADEDTSFLSLAASLATAPAPLPPLHSDASSPRFEILGTEPLDASAAVEGEDPLASGSITHILIREPPPEEPRDREGDDRCLDRRFMREDVVQQASDEDPRPAPGKKRRGAAAAAAPAASSSASTAAATSSAAAAAAAATPTYPSLYIDKLKRSPLRRDNTVWHSRILPPLRQFGHFVTRFLARPHWQREYLLCRTPEAKHAFLAAAGVVPQPVERKRQYAYARNTTGANAAAAKKLRDAESDALAMAAITSQAADVRVTASQRNKINASSSSTSSVVAEPIEDASAKTTRKRQTKPKKPAKSKTILEH